MNILKRFWDLLMEMAEQRSRHLRDNPGLMKMY